MLITRKNREKIYPCDRCINIPRKKLFLTILVHNLILFIGLLTCYNVMAGVAVWIIAYEVIHSFGFVMRVWVMSGYSKKLFIIGHISVIIIEFIAAWALRGYILKSL